MRNEKLAEFAQQLQVQAEELGVMVLILPRDMAPDRDSIIRCYEAIEKVVNAGPGNWLVNSTITFKRKSES